MWSETTFETIRLNDAGEITDRWEGHAKAFGDPLAGDQTLEMILVPGGTFLMGSPAREGYEDEHPQHEVQVPAFLLGRHPVTQAQWHAIMNWAPLYRSHGADRPADRISWLDAVAFCRRLAKRTGHDYRLPSEAEWEYACRAGTTTPFFTGPTLTTAVANFNGLHTYAREPAGVYRHESDAVASFPPNALGLHDMHGTVWEWCQDVWHSSYVNAPTDGSPWEQDGSPHQHVLRGGSWHEPPALCRSAVRLKLGAREAEDIIGFRVALTLSSLHPTH